MPRCFRLSATPLVLCAALSLVSCSPHESKKKAADPDRGVGPIVAGLSPELLSPQSDKKHKNPEEVAFVSVDPANCAGAAQEVDPPFLMHDPVALNNGSWAQNEGRMSMVEEIAGVYHSDFEPEQAISSAAKSLDSCQGATFTIRTRISDAGKYRLLPHQDSGSPNILLWSFSSVSRDWACDNALVAAYNAAVEITTCSFSNGTDVLALAKGALERINKLAKPLD
ncbi:MAG: sensor domain-containing protein [Segniliparus sp.]|uniref:sensor domain-containing protein n=1 Tax=Segniliparus sp. TaxID=2804064 RepID=UPI003F371990